MKVAPSLLSADFMHLDKDVAMLNESADIIHLDVMDGTFVPNMSFGFSVVKPVIQAAKITTDVHLMVVEPQRWFETLAKMGADMVSFHYEAAGRNSSKYLAQIRSLGMKAGIVINPDIPVEKLYPYVGKADFFLIMSVFAGFGGQKFIYESIDRVAALRKYLDKKGDKALIEVDGGIDAHIAAALSEAGADIAVAGSSVFKADDPKAVMAAIKES